MTRHIQEDFIGNVPIAETKKSKFTKETIASIYNQQTNEEETVPGVFIEKTLNNTVKIKVDGKTVEVASSDFVDVIDRHMKALYGRLENSERTGVEQKRIIANLKSVVERLDGKVKQLESRLGRGKQE